MLPIEIAALSLFIVLGACFGSFINAAAFRAANKESVAKGRSKCPHCQKTLTWVELIPLLSYLALRGRCRGCKTPVSPRYLLVEVIFALASALCYIRFGFSWMTLIAYGVLLILLAIALIDMQTMEIPDGLIIALIPFAAAAAWFYPGISLLQRGIGLPAVALPMLILALVIAGGFGGGDIKLMAVCGFLLGWQNILFAFFLAVMVGGSYALVLLAGKKKKKGEHIAFGPYLCAGVATAMLYGERIIAAYLGLFGL
jgi:leader peptidase (prepilin peptidase)/N-methyltransferase